jgi:hypothetical protein
MFQSSYGSYGADESIFMPGKRRRLNLTAVCANIFLPWFVFCGISSLMSFNVHYTAPLVAKASIVAGLVIAAMMALLGYRAKQRDADPAWFNFATMAVIIATIAGTVSADMNYWYNMHTFYDLQTLNTYPAINPAIERGQQMMDAGRVYFAAGTHLDTKKAIAFKNNDLYCVAPITHDNGHLASYDFWAVGLNCCSGVSSDFRCGEYYNPHARSGLRLMRDDQRPFFRLAVQQAEAAYNIKSAHPLFFYWLQDPIAEMNNYRDDGFKWFLLGIFAHFGFNTFCVLCATVGFSKIGRFS